MCLLKSQIKNNKHFRNALIVTLMYFLNSFFKSFSSSQLLKFYFNDFLAGVFATIFFQQVNSYLQIKNKNLIPDIILPILMLILGFIWEEYSSIFFINTTSDYLDIIAYLVWPLYYYFKIKMGVHYGWGNY